MKEKKYIIEIIKKNIWYHTTTITTTTNNSELIIIFLLYICYDVNYKLISEYKYTVKEQKNWVETFKLKEEEKKKSKQSMEWL